MAFYNTNFYLPWQPPPPACMFYQQTGSSSQAKHHDSSGSGGGDASIAPLRRPLGGGVGGWGNGPPFVPMPSPGGFQVPPSANGMLGSNFGGGIGLGGPPPPPSSHHNALHPGGIHAGHQHQHQHQQQQQQQQQQAQQQQSQQQQHHNHQHGHSGHQHGGHQHGHVGGGGGVVNVGHNHHGPHHPSFGSSATGAMHLGQQHTGGMGMGGHGGPGGAQYGGMGGFGGMQGGSSPPRVPTEPSVPLTAHWQHQLLRAENSRIASSPHHRARSAAMASRMSNKPPAATSAVTISDPNRPSSSQSMVNGSSVHKKTTSTSLSVATTCSPPGSEPSVTPVMHADPMNPAQPPAPTSKDDEPYEPWTGLDLGGVRLRNLSPSLFTFSHITALYINHNQLTSLPPSISQLRQLTTLDATGNEMKSVPPELGLLCKLKELLLFDNKLTTLPLELGTLYNLETLGIEGNPLEDRIRKKIAEEGTSAFIAELRDSCPIGPPPPDREWVTIEPDMTSPSTINKMEQFTVLSYNILCHSFAPSTSYGYTPSWALDWNYRKATILNEILNGGPDIVCLQEIATEQFTTFFYPQLQQHGYEGSHYARTRARTMAAEDAKMVDGCATFWKTSKFKLIETQVIEFNQIALGKTEMRTDDMFNRVMSRDNIGTTTALEFVHSGAKLMVANAHIYWDHRYRDVKLVQIGMFLEKLEEVVERFGHYPPRPPSSVLAKAAAAQAAAASTTNSGTVSGDQSPATSSTGDSTSANAAVAAALALPDAPTYSKYEKGRDIPLILCIDSNSLAKSAVHQFISSGDLSPDHEDFMTHTYGPYTTRGLKHRLGLRSSCASFGEMRMTNFTPTFEEVIDYIFYTPRSIRCTGILGDVDRGYLEKVVGFPNAHFPSDHIPVLATFRIKAAVDPASE